jgi:hypothetical protein
MKPAFKPREPDLQTEAEMPNEVEELTLSIVAAAGLKSDDDDDRDDEHANENEAPVRETNEEVEAPEEFEVDDEKTPGFKDDDSSSDPDDDEDDEDIE